ncbi:sigma-70 family RNA polymerase sigma factor [bacterium]|nr:sigma-70 family RNA polymerase sigma factor [bacterium]
MCADSSHEPENLNPQSSQSFPSDTELSGTPIELDDPSLVANYEPYLRMLARTRMRKSYQAKIGVSDVVQQTMLQAVQAFEQFRGKTEEEFLAWLRQILARHLCHVDRDLHRDKRDIRREQSMEQQLAASSLRLRHFLAGDGPTPSQNVMLGEHVLRLSNAIDRLPESQGESIRLHYIEGLKLSEISERIGKSTGAVAGLMHRGMKTLRSQLGD